LKLHIAQVRSSLQGVRRCYLTGPGERFCLMTSSLYFISRTILFQVTAAVFRRGILTSVNTGCSNAGRLIFFMTVARDIYGSTVRNLSHIPTLRAPRIFKWLLDHSEVCAPLCPSRNSDANLTITKRHVKFC
jgi:hypothetical protein